VAETSNSTIRKIDMTTGAITTLAGTAGVSGWNDATGTAALFNRPAGIWGDGINLYVCDEENYVIRKIVLATGAVTTIAGMPNTSGLTDGIGSAARFDDPRAIWGDGTQLYVSQLEATGIRRIALSNFAVTTIPGTAVPGFEDYVTGISGNGAQLFAVDVENTVRTLTPDAAQLPSTSSMSPSTGAAGTTFPVIIKGAGFVPGTTVSAINGNGLSVSSAIATGPGTVIANFTIAPGSVTGPRTVTVATPAGSTNIIFNVQ
jgi:hypothetical protein